LTVERHPPRHIPEDQLVPIEESPEYLALVRNALARAKELQDCWDACHEQHRAADAEVERLRARVAELEARLPVRAGSVDHLNQLLDAAYARIAELEAEVKGYQMLERARD
jgi:hypothetical protein